LLGFVILTVLVVSTLGIQLHLDIQGVNLDMTREIREVLLVVATSLAAYSAYVGFQAVNLAGCLEAVLKRTGMPKPLWFKYRRQPELTVEILTTSALFSPGSLGYVVQTLVVALLTVLHLVAFAVLYYGAFYYVAIEIMRDPALGTASYVIAWYAIISTTSVLILSSSLGLIPIRNFRPYYEKKYKEADKRGEKAPFLFKLGMNDYRYHKMFYRISSRRHGKIPPPVQVGRILGLFISKKRQQRNAKRVRESSPSRGPDPAV
jgi:hypothetical protein